MSEISYEMAAAKFAAEGLDLTAAQFQQLQRYLEKLVETNRQMNLTAITEPAQIWAKHFLDSAVLLRKISLPMGAACLDVGTGAGFPGLVLAILRKELQVTLLDSLQKRVHFLEETAAELGLQNVTCIHGRAEELARKPEFREQFDFVTARAVAALPVLTEYCLPFVKVGGAFAAMKGPGEAAEEAAAAAKALGGGVPEAVSYVLPDVGERQVIRIVKFTPTPGRFPRRGDKIRKAAMMRG